MDSMRFRNKVAFVTGGASGIGKAIAERFVSEGGKVMAADRTIKKLKTSANLKFIKVDVSREKEMKRALEKTRQVFGKIDIVVNNAGIWGMQELKKLTEKEVDRIFGVNTKGVLWGMKHAFKYLRRPNAKKRIGGKGVILNIASIAGLMSEHGWTSYDISKTSVIAATKVAALEYGKHGIRVNAIAPGAIATPLILKENQLKNPPSDPWIKTLPIPRYGRPEDVAALAAFLCSDEADYITAGVYNVDGGALAGWLEEW